MENSPGDQKINLTRGFCFFAFSVRAFVRVRTIPSFMCLVAGHDLAEIASRARTSLVGGTLDNAAAGSLLVSNTVHPAPGIGDDGVALGAVKIGRIEDLIGERTGSTGSTRGVDKLTAGARLHLLSEGRSATIADCMLVWLITVTSSDLIAVLVHHRLPGVEGISSLHRHLAANAVECIVDDNKAETDNGRESIIGVIVDVVNARLPKAVATTSGTIKCKIHAAIYLRSI